jgi:CRISPR system Cascade subunit CasE
MHAAVLAGFPHADPASGRVLWRVDRNDERVLLYVVSPDRPDWTHIAEQAGWPTLTDTWAVRSYDSLLDRLAPGQQWAFRLTANPVRNVDGKRMGHVTAAQQQEWLLSRVERFGFRVRVNDSVPDVFVHDRQLERFTRQNAQVTIAKASFDGVLEVIDTGLLRKALTHGIGHGKSYGCGLLTLAPLHP